MAKANYVSDKIMVKILKAVIGKGKNIYIDGSRSVSFAKDDVMVYKAKNGDYTIYLCTKAGKYKAPDDTNFKELKIRGSL